MNPPPEELLSRCEALQDPIEQGEPLQRNDYLLLLLATLLLPAILVAVGTLL